MSKPIPDWGVCFTRHISKVSDIWCSECGEGLCTNCKQHHSASKSTTHHVTVQIEECRKLGVFISEINELCEKHNKIYQMFCKKNLKIPKIMYIEEEQTTQWPKEKAQKDKQRSTTHTYKTKDLVTRTPLKTGGELLEMIIP